MAQSRSWKGRTRPLLGCVYLLVLVAFGWQSVEAASSDKPELHHTLFDNLPARIFYFDDTPVSHRTCHNPVLAQGLGTWRGAAGRAQLREVTRQSNALNALCGRKRVADPR